MSIIIATTTDDIWKQAQAEGEYHNSTITSMLPEVGFIHCTTPDQTIEMVNRHFADRSELVLLVIDTDKVKPEVKFEAPLSGRPGLFPHIYGPLNINAVVDTLRLVKDTSGHFTAPDKLIDLQSHKGSEA